MNKLKYVTAAIALVACASTANAETSMGIVVKIGGIPWFNAMEEGIKERAAELGVSAEMIGPTSADPALQVRAIEDLIAKGVDVIGVVPNDEAALEPVLKKAMDAGIKVVAHEGPGLNNVDWNFELASADGFGEAHAKLLCEKQVSQAHTQFMWVLSPCPFTTLGPMQVSSGSPRTALTSCSRSVTAMVWPKVWMTAVRQHLT